MRVHFTNLGCKLNQAELEQLAREFVAAGHHIAASLEDADLHVINSCTVTHVAARTSRKVARRGRRVNPRLKTVLTGCYATDSPDTTAGLAGVDLVIANDEKDRLLDIVHHHLGGRTPPNPEPQLPIPYGPLDFGNTRALVKIQDGCNMRCTFCIIPFTRGPERSRPVDDVVNEVQALVAGGFQEIVITGVQISSYHSEGRGLYELTTVLLEHTDVPRLRLTSIAPWEFDERLLALWTDRRLCRHIHMSLQSGCTATLRRMRRPYTAEMYAGVAEMIREAIPDVAITTDVIVGFSGETTEEFQQSLRFVQHTGFAKVHVFPYSARQGTEAATMPAHVPYQEKKARVDAMLEVADASEKQFQQRFLGHQLDVLWESRQTCTEPFDRLRAGSFDPSTGLRACPELAEGTGSAQACTERSRSDKHSRSNGYWQGVTDNYIRVLTGSPNDLSNTITRTRLVRLADEGVIGSVISDQRSEESPA